MSTKGKKNLSNDLVCGRWSQTTSAKSNIKTTQNKIEIICEFEATKLLFLICTLLKLIPFCNIENVMSLPLHNLGWNKPKLCKIFNHFLRTE